MRKVLIVTEGMTPYRIPVWNKIGEDPTIELTVLYLSEKENNRKWNIDYNEINFNYVVQNGKQIFIQSMDLGIHLNPGLFNTLKKYSPDLIITTSYHVIGFWMALLYTKLYKKKFMVWWGSTLNSSRVSNPLMNSIRRFYFNNSDTFLTYGNEASEALRYYKVKDKDIFTGYNTVDIRYYYKTYKEIKNSQEKYKNNIVKFVFIGQLIKRKGIKELLEAIVKLRNNNWELHVIGDGVQIDEIKSFIKLNKIQNKVILHGFLQKNEVVEILGDSDCLVFPSLREVWGLVVNEALITNTFVLSSIYAGATKDIINNYQNGIEIDPYDKDDLIEKLNWVMVNICFVRESKTPLSIWKKLHDKTYANNAIRAINEALDRR
jgi:glycosyltransferase involved in cell wall biosynthesis